MSLRTQVFVVEVAASVMPSLTAAEVEDAVRRLAYAKERPHGMGALDVCAYEGFNERSTPVTVTDWAATDEAPARTEEFALLDPDQHAAARAAWLARAGQRSDERKGHADG